jgi:hypothetical protein
MKNNYEKQRYENRASEAIRRSFEAAAQEQAIHQGAPQASD